ncbi:Hypothetical protein D9617_5g071400 [Elsinoe fawcettii]|nr:Hypothetical protein D9617_5g071400 [Elsinoe fawcettii]
MKTKPHLPFEVALACSLLTCRWGNAYALLRYRLWPSKEDREAKRRDEEEVQQENERARIDDAFQRQRMTDGPRPSPSNQRRRLSAAENVQRQVECPLLSLPWEIRERIWRLALCNQNYAIYRGHRRLVATVITDAQSEDFNRTSKRPRLEHNAPEHHILGLPRCSHQIYIETIEMVYATNTFHLLQNDTVQELKRTILPQRFESLTSVVVHFYFRNRDRLPGPPWMAIHQPPWDFETWEYTLFNLATLPRLQRLRINVRGDMTWLFTIHDILSRAGRAGIRVEPRIGSFEIFATWMEEPSSEEKRAAGHYEGRFPFKVIRPETFTRFVSEGPEVYGPDGQDVVEWPVHNHAGN